MTGSPIPITPTASIPIACDAGRRFEGRACVVTGAARGIGRAIAERLPRESGRGADNTGETAFLASDDSCFVAVRLCAVDGGVSSTHPHGKIPV